MEEVHVPMPHFDPQMYKSKIYICGYRGPRANAKGKFDLIPWEIGKIKGLDPLLE